MIIVAEFSLGPQVKLKTFSALLEKHGGLTS